MGEVKVPADAYYGAQTQRSIENFQIAQDINKMPKEIIRAFAYLKKAAALTNQDAGVLPAEKAALIGQVCDEILDGKLDAYFPLVVWQTGSGTQSNMNVNEVVAYRGHVLKGGQLTDKEKFLHPIFNIADASISVGVITLFIFQKRFFKKQDQNEVHPTAETSAQVSDKTQVL